jgi:hypothetical protein
MYFSCKAFVVFLLNKEKGCVHPLDAEAGGMPSISKRKRKKLLHKLCCALHLLMNPFLA